METQLKKQDLTFNDYALEELMANGTDNLLKSVLRENMVAFIKKADEIRIFFEQNVHPDMIGLLTKLAPPLGKTSFLVVKNNKYVSVATENIAYFYIKYGFSKIMSFEGQEYFVDHSLEQIQNLLPGKQFCRINRQYLVNFRSVKEVEHYFARKLLVNLVVPTKDKLFVSKEKVSDFLYWLDDR